MIEIPTSIKQISIETNLDKYKQEVLQDLWICLISRESSIIGRREVLTGKGKFGIFGSGKEVIQVAMARAFNKGDFRAGYYRDQTLMFALGLMSVQEMFSQLYADVDNDPSSNGRQMVNHPATRLVNEDGSWTNHMSSYNITADISNTAGQMARGFGLAEASKKYRALGVRNQFTDNGNELTFVNIGDASTSEGAFWETMNAATVNRVPMLVTVYDDGYGISVPKELQTTKASISKALSGFQLDDSGDGMRIISVKAWDYANLCTAYERIAREMREDHIPALIHATEATQPLGHSTSGSHGRYKSPERLQFEEDYDGIERMIEWILINNITTKEEIDDLRAKARKYVIKEKDEAWKKVQGSPLRLKSALLDVYGDIDAKWELEHIKKELSDNRVPEKAEVLGNARRMYQELIILGVDNPSLKYFIDKFYSEEGDIYHTDLYSDSDLAAINVVGVPVSYDENAKEVNGFQILNKFFDNAFKTNKNLLAFGEDLGRIGGVNQAFSDLQQKHGVDRIYDTGIREWTIIGSAIGMSMRGLRPIAEIQYLDYLLYGLSPLSDDLATLRYRSAGQQQAPAIIRTRGHRLEGIWHSGSPMGMMLNSLRGIYILVPRDMTRAAGFYNTLLSGNDPGIVVECLNGYRLKERLPNNLNSFKLPLGMPEILKEGSDITLVTYGTSVRIVEEAVDRLTRIGVNVELIDIQSLIPFDLEHHIVASIKKTNRLLIVDEDIKSGASAYILQKIMEEQEAFYHLDVPPSTLCSREHRTPYGSDGDYFTKPNSEDVFDRVMELLRD